MCRLTMKILLNVYQVLIQFGAPIVGHVKDDASSISQDSKYPDCIVILMSRSCCYFDCGEEGLNWVGLELKWVSLGAQISVDLEAETGTPPPDVIEAVAETIVTTIPLRSSEEKKKMLQPLQQQQNKDHILQKERLTRTYH
ncbi:hypothetical protein Tco_0012861 [Tanacetum coccineum]